MTAELVDLKKQKPNASLIEMLEALLVDAKNGNITGAAFVFEYSDLCVGTCFDVNCPVLAIGELMNLIREIQDCKIDLRLHKAGEYYG